jgi:hypothetical protein
MNKIKNLVLIVYSVLFVGVVLAYFKNENGPLAAALIWGVIVCPVYFVVYPLSSVVDKMHVPGLLVSGKNIVDLVVMYLLGFFVYFAIFQCIEILCGFVNRAISSTRKKK